MIPLRSPLSVDHGVLNLPTINTATGITVLDSNGLDGSISFSGAAGDINTMLSNGVEYFSNQNANGDGYATLTMTTSDGTATDTDTATINVSAVNDTPTFSQSYGIWEDFYNGAETHAVALQPDGKLIVTAWENDEYDMVVIPTT